MRSFGWFFWSFCSQDQRRKERLLWTGQAEHLSGVNTASTKFRVPPPHTHTYLHSLSLIQRHGIHCWGAGACSRRGAPVGRASLLVLLAARLHGCREDGWAEHKWKRGEEPQDPSRWEQKHLTVSPTSFTEHVRSADKVTDERLSLFIHKVGEKN